MVENNKMEIDEIVKKVTEKTKKYKEPLWENRLIYDSFAEALEPVYFWILDFMQGLDLEVEKLVDNFAASPGSGYFGDLGARATKMQETGIKILGDVNAVIKSIINLIYDLKEWEIRLKDYENVKSEDEATKEIGVSALKHRWMDNVDANKGTGSINAMTNQYGFTTLRDGFMTARSPEDVDAMDLNERVRRILKPRVAEFFEWLKRSEIELKKRYEIERSYLKTQVNTLKLYTSWVKPYIKAAEQLRMKETKTPALVTAFNTMILELALFSKKEIDVKYEAENKNLPERFAKLELRKYYPCVFIDLLFRGIPRAVKVGGTQHYVHGGRSEVKFRAYALNEDEITLFHKKIEEEDLGYLLGIAKDVTEESLKQLTEDIEYFSKKEKKETEEEKERKGEVNPFVALGEGIADVFGLRKKLKEKREEKEEGKETEEEKEKKKAKKLEEEGIRKDSYEESVVREFAEKIAKELCFKIFDTYKKAHGMAAFPSPPSFEEKERK